MLQNTTVNIIPNTRFCGMYEKESDEFVGVVDISNKKEYADDKIVDLLNKQYESILWLRLRVMELSNELTAIRKWGVDYDK